MPRIRWSDTWTIWDEELDQHHQQLVRYLQVLDAPEEHGDTDFLRQIVDGLCDYASFHFTAEERRMETLGYPDLAAHRVEHAEFARDVVVFREEFGRGSSRLDRVLVSYLKDWLLTHILDSDKRFGEWARDRRAAGQSKQQDD